MAEKNKDKPPHSEFEKDGRLRIVIAGLDKNIRQQGVEAAQTRLNAETNEKGFFKGFIKGRIWKGNLAREYYLAKYQREAEGQIRENDNLLHHEERSDEAARVATTLRYASEYENEVVHEGETREHIESDTSTEAQQIKTAVKDLLKQYASGTLDDDSFEEEKRRQMTMLAENGVSKKYIGEGLIYADNLLQVAQNVKHAIDHGQAMDDLLENAEFVVGEARLGARTEAKLSGTERMMKKLEGKAFVHEATVATAVSIAYSAAQWAGKRAVSAAGKMAIPGLGAGMIAAMRENRMIKEERAQHSREMAEGKTYDENESGNKRREKLEGSRYETKTAKDLTDQLSLLYDDEGSLRINGDRGRFDEAMAIVAETQARTRISDRDKLDLISFSNIEAIETERFNLDLALAKAKVDLRHMLTTIPDSELIALGIQPTDITDARLRGMDALAFVLDPRIDATEGVLGGEMTEKDRVFNKLRAKRVAGAFAKGTVLGATIGLYAQEVSAIGTHLEEIHSGVPASHQTLIEATLLGNQGGTGEHAQQVVLSGEHGKPIELSHVTKLTLPAEFHAHVANGMLSVSGPNGIEVHDLPIGHNGTLSPNAVAALNQSGFHLATAHEVLKHTVTTHERIAGSEFVANHHNMTTHVTRDFWYDNGTPNIFESRELQLDLHHDAQGNIVFDAGRMGLTEQQLHHMQLALSATKGDQHNPFMEHFNGHGQAVIEKNSPLAAMFHNGPDGQPVYDGQYAEASEVAGTDTHGITHIRPLATVVGEGRGSFTDTVTHTETQPATSYVVTYQAPTVAPGPERVVDVPPVIPIYSRRGLGPTENPPGMPITREQDDVGERVPPNEVFYYGMNSESLQQWLDNNRDRMRPRTRTRLPDGTYEWREADGSEVVRDLDRERSTISDYLESIRRDEPDYYAELERLGREPIMHEMSDNCRVAVNIPAWMEGQTIYNLLQMYANQTDRDGNPVPLDMYEINVCVNRKTGADPDNTVAEIQRFLAESDAVARGLRVNFIDVEFDPPYNNVGHARRVITDLTMMRSLARTSQAGPLYIESEDADILRLDPHTVYNVVTKLDQNPYLDAVRGMTDRMPELLEQNDYLFMTLRLWDITEALLRSQEYRPENNPNWSLMWHRVTTNGWNSALTAESYAMVRGYNDQSSVGEDMEIGQKITALRGDGAIHNTHAVGRVYSRSDSSPRRFIAEVITGQPAYSGSFTDEGLNDFIRSSSVQDMIDRISDVSRINDQNTDRFKGVLQSYYRKFVTESFAPDLAATQQLFNRLALFIGLKPGDYTYSADGRDVTINSLDNVAGALNDYRARHAGDTAPEPPVESPEEQERRQLLESIEGDADTVYNGTINGEAGPYRFLGEASGDYTFERLSPSGTADIDLQVLSTDQVVDLLRNGTLAPEQQPLI